MIGMLQCKDDPSFREQNTPPPTLVLSVQTFQCKINVRMLRKLTPPCIPGGEGCTCPLTEKDAMTKLHPKPPATHQHLKWITLPAMPPSSATPHPLFFGVGNVPGFLGTINKKFPAISSCQIRCLKWPNISPWVTIMACL